MSANLTIKSDIYLTLFLSLFFYLFSRNVTNKRSKCLIFLIHMRGIADFQKDGEVGWCLAKSESRSQIPSHFLIFFIFTVALKGHEKIPTKMIT